jgi:hypothetical protein
MTEYLNRLDQVARMVASAVPCTIEDAGDAVQNALLEVVEHEKEFPDLRGIIHAGIWGAYKIRRGDVTREKYEAQYPRYVVQEPVEVPEHVERWPKRCSELVKGCMEGQTFAEYAESQGVTLRTVQRIALECRDRLARETSVGKRQTYTPRQAHGPFFSTEPVTSENIERRIRENSTCQ